MRAPSALSLAQSDCLAALTEGFSFIGIEKEADYFEISKRRIFYKFPEFKKQVKKIN